MTARTHVLFSLPFGAGVVAADMVVTEGTALFFGMLLLGSLLPDIDEPNSFIGRKMPFISYPANAILGHRGPSHYLLIPAILFAAAFFLPPMWSAALFGLSVGWFSHILGDLFFGNGIEGLLYPLYFGNVRITKLKVGGAVEHALMIALFVGFLVWLYQFSSETIAKIQI